MKNWKRNLIAAIAAGCAALLLLFAFMTPMGALRLSVLTHGYPVEAFIAEIRPATAQDHVIMAGNPANCAIYNLDGAVPHDWATDSNLENWIVYQYGPFFVADCYGYL